MDGMMDLLFRLWLTSLIISAFIPMIGIPFDLTTDSRYESVGTVVMVAFYYFLFNLFAAAAFALLYLVWHG
jgi:hypothetical protein